jgi:uncharacterized membrane protein YccC
MIRTLRRESVNDALRASLAALSSLILARLLRRPEVYWAAMTAIIVI